MDAYDLHEKLLAEWRNLALVPNAGSVKKFYNQVPVCVVLNGSTYTVAGINTKDGKVILEII